MGSLREFLDAGPERTKKLGEFFDRTIAEPLNYYFGPTGVPQKANSAMRLGEYSDAGDMQQYQQTGTDFFNSPSLGNAVNYATAGAALAVPFVGGKMIADGVDVVGDAVRSGADDLRRFAGDEVGAVPLGRGKDIPQQPFDMGRGPVQPGDYMRDAYQARAGQMQLKPSDRIQPRPNRERLLDQDYQTPSPVVFEEDLSSMYPRNPDPSAPLPLGDRARTIVDRQPELSAALAERIKKTGQMGEDTRYFYHSDGPIYRAARNAGLSHDEASQYLNDFSKYFAATSPRTKVEDNLRSATSAMAKTAQGIPHRQIVGPGSGGISEKGYPMMTGKGGIHGNLLDQVIEKGHIDTTTNPKPATFGANMTGNRSGVTVDTHAIRGTLQTLNEIEPGAVPERFIVPKFRDAYKKDPSVLTPDMIMDTLGDQKIGPKGATYSAQTEYPVFADVWHGAADELGVSPAEAQSMGWFGFGDQTNLGSAKKTVADIFDERLDVTAQALKITPEEAARRVFTRQMPLLGVGGLGMMLGYDQKSEEQALRDYLTK